MLTYTVYSAYYNEEASGGRVVQKLGVSCMHARCLYRYVSVHIPRMSKPSESLPH